MSGLDLEVLCGRWDKPAGGIGGAGGGAGGGRAAPVVTCGTVEDALVTDLPGNSSSAGFAFRGDGRWLGVSKSVGVDVLAGLTAAGSLVLASVT